MINSTNKSSKIWFGTGRGAVRRVPSWHSTLKKMVDENREALQSYRRAFDALNGASASSNSPLASASETTPGFHRRSSSLMPPPGYHLNTGILPAPDTLASQPTHQPAQSLKRKRSPAESSPLPIGSDRNSYKIPKFSFGIPQASSEQKYPLSERADGRHEGNLKERKWQQKHNPQHPAADGRNQSEHIMPNSALIVGAPRGKDPESCEIEAKAPAYYEPYHRDHVGTKATTEVKKTGTLTPADQKRKKQASKSLALQGFGTRESYEKAMRAVLEDQLAQKQGTQFPNALGLNQLGYNGLIRENEVPQLSTAIEQFRRESAIRATGLPYFLYRDASTGETRTIPIGKPVRPLQPPVNRSPAKTEAWTLANQGKSEAAANASRGKSRAEMVLGLDFGWVNAENARRLRIAQEKAKEQDDIFIKPKPRERWPTREEELGALKYFGGEGSPTAQWNTYSQLSQTFDTLSLSQHTEAGNDDLEESKEQLKDRVHHSYKSLSKDEQQILVNFRKRINTARITSTDNASLAKDKISELRYTLKKLFDVNNAEKKQKQGLSVAEVVQIFFQNSVSVILPVQRQFVSLTSDQKFLQAVIGCKHADLLSRLQSHAAESRLKLTYVEPVWPESQEGLIEFVPHSNKMSKYDGYLLSREDINTNGVMQKTLGTIILTDYDPGLRDSVAGYLQKAMSQPDRPIPLGFLPTDAVTKMQKALAEIGFEGRLIKQEKTLMWISKDTSNGKTFIPRAKTPPPPPLPSQLHLIAFTSPQHAYRSSVYYCHVINPTTGKQSTTKILTEATSTRKSVQDYLKELLEHPDQSIDCTLLKASHRTDLKKAMAEIGFEDRLVDDPDTKKLAGYLIWRSS